MLKAGKTFAIQPIKVTTFIELWLNSYNYRSVNAFETNNYHLIWKRWIRKVFIIYRVSSLALVSVCIGRPLRYLLARHAKAAVPHPTGQGPQSTADLWPASIVAGGAPALIPYLGTLLQLWLTGDSGSCHAAISCPDRRSKHCYFPPLPQSSSLYNNDNFWKHSCLTIGGLREPLKKKRVL